MSNVGGFELSREHIDDLHRAAARSRLRLIAARHGDGDRFAAVADDAPAGTFHPCAIRP